MMCTRGPCRAPPSCRCVQWVRGGPREGGGGRGRAPEPRAQKMQQAGSMYTQRDAQHGVHDAPRKIATAAAAAAACGRARGARAAPAACKGDPGAAHRGLARASLTRRCRENPGGRGWNTKNVSQILLQNVAPPPPSPRRRSHAVDERSIAQLQKCILSAKALHQQLLERGGERRAVESQRIANLPLFHRQC